MHIASLRDLYLAELQEARSFEGQIADAVGGLAEKAGDTELRDVLRADKPESLGHGARVGEILEGHDAAPRAHEDQTMKAILSEAERWADEIDDQAVRDAAIIASMQRIQHYEIAAYGALAAWAKLQGLEEAGTLAEILEQEKAADARLNAIARQKVNAEAA
jgi:ferritin-like metal-binding protein YciE